MVSVTSSEFSTPTLSRRREPRVVVSAMLTARSLTPGGPEVLAVRDLGFRGFAIETDSPVQSRTRAKFEFASEGILLFDAEAVSVHCFHQPKPAERWISGWEFPEQEGLDAKIEKLIEEAAGTLTVE